MYKHMEIVLTEDRGYAVKRITDSGKVSVTPYGWNTEESAQDYIDVYMKEAAR